MSKQARAYWLLVVGAGVCLSASILSRWHPTDAELRPLGLYILAAIATSRFKVRLPGIFSTLSMNYVFVIAGLCDLDLGAGLLIGFASVLGQTFLKFKKCPQWHHIVFNLSQISLAVSAASICIEHLKLSSVDPYGMVPIVGASLAYFLVNTLVLSGMIGITAKKGIFGTWRESLLWTSPQYTGRRL